MISYFKSLFVLILSALLFGSCSQPQPEEPNPVRRKSPIAIAKTLHQPADTYIKIVYGQPYKRGRKIFGELVPYNEVWRTGANEATELTTTKSVLFGGKKLDPGTYTFFTIPKENEPWTIILNNKLGQWGAFDYQQEFDELRVDAPAMERSTSAEAFTMQFTEIEDDSTNIILRWDQTEVKIPVEFISDSTSTS